MPTRFEETSGLSIVSMLLFIYHKKFEGLKLFDLQLREYIFFSFTVFFSLFHFSLLWGGMPKFLVLSKPVQDTCESIIYCHLKIYIYIYLLFLVNVVSHYTKT